MEFQVGDASRFGGALGGCQQIEKGVLQERRNEDRDRAALAVDAQDATREALRHKVQGQAQSCGALSGGELAVAFRQRPAGGAPDGAVVIERHDEHLDPAAIRVGDPIQCEGTPSSLARASAKSWRLDGRKGLAAFGQAKDGRAITVGDQPHDPARIGLTGIQFAGQ